MTSISFIVCALNEELYIEDCISSIKREMSQYILQRPATLYEIIVVDNGSTDNTWLKASQDGVKVIFEPKPGISNARQTGFNNSQNDWCAFIDADSRLTKGWFQVACKAFDNDNIVAVSGSLHFYDVPQYINIATKGFYKIAQLFHRIWPTIQGGNYIAKRNAIIQSNPFNPSLDFWGEDTYTATQLAKVGRIKLEPRMIMDTSGRRLLQDGVVKTTSLYILNYLSGNILHRPATKRFENFR